MDCIDRSITENRVSVVAVDLSVAAPDISVIVPDLSEAVTADILEATLAELVAGRLVVLGLKVDTESLSDGPT